MGNKAWVGRMADGLECVVVARSPIEAARLARVDAEDFPHRFDIDRAAGSLLDRVRGVYVRDDKGQFTVKLRAQADVARALGLSRQAFNSRVDTWRGRGLSEADAIKKAAEGPAVRVDGAIRAAAVESGVNESTMASRVRKWMATGKSREQAIEAAKTGPVMPPGRPRKEAA